MSPPRKSEIASDSESRVDETPVGAVVTAVAEATGQSPPEMEPLGEVVDTDALNALVSSAGEPTSSVAVAFDYCGERATVTADDVRIAPSE